MGLDQQLIAEFESLLHLTYTDHWRRPWQALEARAGDPMEVCG